MQADHSLTHVISQDSSLWADQYVGLSAQCKKACSDGGECGG
jgi:hypothetical protein